MAESEHTWTNMHCFWALLGASRIGSEIEHHCSSKNTQHWMNGLQYCDPQEKDGNTVNVSACDNRLPIQTHPKLVPVRHIIGFLVYCPSYLYSGQSVCNDNDCPASHQPLYCLLYCSLTYRVLQYTKQNVILLTDFHSQIVCDWVSRFQRQSTTTIREA